MVHEVRDQEELQKVGRRLVKRLLAACVLALAAAGIIGCASYTEETREIRSLFRADQYRAAYEKLEASALKQEDKNKLLYRLEKAMIQERMGEGAKARTTLLEADKIADQLYTTSVTRTAASFVMNDSASDYSGEDYEKVAIHTMLALSYLNSGELDSARVEAKKINNKLSEINGGYDDNKNRYAQDGFAMYLAAMIYEARGEIDDAIIDYGKAIEAYAGPYAEFVDGGVPKELLEAYARVLIRRNRDDKLSVFDKKHPAAVKAARAALKDCEDCGEIIVIHQLGHIAIKEAREFFIGGGRQVIRISFPVVTKRGGAEYWGGTGFTVDGGGKLNGGDNVQALDNIARASLEDRRLRMIAKQTARLVTKGVLTEQAYQNFGPLGGLAANVFSAVTETADTRGWTLLPEAIFVSRALVKPGKRSLEVKTGGRVGQHPTVDVKKGKIAFLVDVG